MHANESRHTYEWVTSKSHGTYLSDVTGGKHPKRGWNRVRSISSTSTHTHESCHTYELSHVTQMNASHMSTSHVTHTPKSHGTISSYATGGKHMEAWLTSHTHRRVTAQFRVMRQVESTWKHGGNIALDISSAPHIYTSHVTNMNWVTSHIWMRRAYERVTSHAHQRVTVYIWSTWQVESTLKRGWNSARGISSILHAYMHHVTHMIWVMSHIWMRHTHERVTSRTHQRVTARFRVMWQVESTLKCGWNRALGISSTRTRKDKLPDAVCVTWLISMRDVIRSYVIHSYVWHDSFTHVTWLTSMSDVIRSYVIHSYVWHDSFTLVTWLICMRDVIRSYVIHSYMWRDSFTLVLWLIRIYNVTHPNVWRDSFVFVMSFTHMPFTHMCDVTHSHLCRGWFESMMWLIRMCDVTYSYV